MTTETTMQASESATLERERRHLEPSLVVEERDGKPTRLVGYAAKFRSLSQRLAPGFREVIAPGAFTKTIQESKDIVCLFNHDPNNLLGAVRNGTLRLSEDAIGLRMEVEPPATQQGRDVLELVKRGDVSGQSFSFGTIKDSWTEGADGRTRVLEEVRVFDVGPVTFPAYQETEIMISARAMQMAAPPVKETIRKEKRTVTQMIKELEAEEGYIPRSAAPQQVLRKTDRRYSLRRLIAGEDGPELDKSRELEERLRADGYVTRNTDKAHAFFVPWSALSLRDLTLTTESADIRQTEHQAPIEVLRRKSAVVAAGATVLEGLVGDVRLPRQTGGIASSWVAEGGAASESTPTFDSVLLQPKTVTCFLDASKQSLVQASEGVETLLRNDLIRALGEALDRAALHGSGASNEPTGIFSTSGIGDVDGGANGLAPTWAHIAELESDVGIANADRESLAFITNSKVRSKLRRTESFAGAGPIWQRSLELAGWPAFCTEGVRSDLTDGAGSNLSAIFFGDWSELLVGLWGGPNGGGFELLVDPFTQAMSGNTRLVAFLACDIGVRHAASFSAMKDAITT